MLIRRHGAIHVNQLSFGQAKHDLVLSFYFHVLVKDALELRDFHGGVTPLECVILEGVLNVMHVDYMRAIFSTIHLDTKI